MSNSIYLARVYVTLKPTVNDPQGLTIRGALHSLGFVDVESVRAGKYLEVSLAAKDRKKAETPSFEDMEQFLRNELSREAGTAYINRLRGGAKTTRFNADGSPLEGAFPADREKP